ncbi:MAG: hypothetical protein MZU97_07710 [Bacillus subtilis]|nr:hypothetical protein [Bacillus subtilis]
MESTGDDKLYRLAVVLLNPKGTAAYLDRRERTGLPAGGRKALSIVQGDAVPQVFIPQADRLLRQRAFPLRPPREILRFRADQPRHRRCHAAAAPSSPSCG